MIDTRPAFVDAATGSVRTHLEVQLRARRLAAVLARTFGVSRGDRVAVLSHNRAEVFETMLACRHLSAIFVPLNWRLASAERAAIVADCRPTVLLHDDILAHEAAALDLPRVSFDIAPGLAADPFAIASGANPVADAGRPAMLLYTSGTSGQPKGVVLTWRQIDFNASVTADRLALGPDDRCLGFLPLFHTGGLHCLATPVLAQGGCVVLMDRVDPERAIAAMRAHAITCTIAVPTIYRMLLDAGLGSGERISSLRHLLMGGASAPETLFERYEMIAHPLLHGYGLTEAGPNCFSFGRRSVGWPMPGTFAEIASDGELLLSGPHLAAGYWNEREAATFAGGVLRTGDLARMGHDGYHIVGRKKEMFISGGENVYPAEVESALAALPGVEDVCVVGVPDDRWGEVGLAAIVPAASAVIAVDDLRELARKRLAPYKIPHHWRVVPELPKGATGKVIRAELAKQWKEAR